MLETPVTLNFEEKEAQTVLRYLEPLDGSAPQDQKLQFDPFSLLLCQEVDSANLVFLSIEIGNHYTNE